MQWPKDDTQSKNAFYGDFHAKGWADQHLIHIFTPYKMYYEKQPMLHGLLVHKLIAPALTLVFNDIWDGCGHSQQAVDLTGASDWGGCWNPRPIAGSTRPSNHSWACAVDISPTTNGFHAGHGTIGNLVVNAFKKQGFLWGGDYHGRTDPMHFEAVSR